MASKSCWALWRRLREGPWDAPWKNCSKNGDVFCTNSHQSLPQTRSAVDAQSFSNNLTKVLLLQHLGPRISYDIFFWITLASKTLSFFLFLYNMVTFHWAIWWVYWHTLERERERHSASNSDSDCNIASFSSPLAKELIIWKIARKNTQFSGNVSSKCLPRNHLGNSSYWTFALNVHEFPANTKYSALTKHNVNCG